jgi:hypothetical protein
MLDALTAVLQPVRQTDRQTDSCTYLVGKAVQNTEALIMSLAFLSQPVDCVSVEPGSSNSPFNQYIQSVELIKLLSSLSVVHRL